MTAALRTPAPSTVKPRRKGLAALLTHRTMRRLTQLGVFLFIAFIAVRHTAVGEGGATITASWEAYCPMGGLESLYKFVTSGGKYVPHVHLSNMILLIATLGVALVARNSFCGWICPLGFIQEMTSSFSAFVQKKLPPVRKAVKTRKARGARLAVLDRYLRFLKYGVLVWVVGGAAAYGFMVFRDVDPWAGLWRLLELSFTFGTVVLLIVLAASLFVERPWCRYACPLGAATGLVGKLSPFYLKRDSSACTNCAICSRACPMGLPVHKAETIKHADCVGCLDCVGECPREGALELRVGLPIAGK
jgi:polyferredoxin